MTKKEFIIFIKRAEQNKCICGCGNIVKNPRNLYITGHHRCRSLQELQNNLILKKRLVSIKLHPCACGCGTLIYRKWAPGHHLIKKDKFSWKGYGKNRNKNYPKLEKIIKAHHLFLNELNITPELCWICQKKDWDVHAHILAVSNKGTNDPINILLLCHGCHTMQGNYSDMDPDWNVEKQYNWIRENRNIYMLDVRAYYNNLNQEKRDAFVIRFLEFLKEMKTQDTVRYLSMIEPCK